MFKMLRTLRCYVRNELLKVSKVFLSSAFAKGAIFERWYEHNMHVLISYLLKLNCYFYRVTYFTGCLQKTCH